MDVKNVRADDLRYLAAVADTGRLVAAARLLGVDHATVSRRIRELEKALGSRLISRGPEGWELTAVGRSVVQHARAIQTSLDRATLAAVGSDEDAAAGLVRVTSADGFGARFVTPALARVRSKHPGLRVELVTGARYLGLRDSSFDIGLTIGAVPAARLFTERLCEYDSAFYASHTYLERHGDPRSLRELAGHELIYFVESLERVKELNLHSYLPDPVVNFSSTNVFALLQAVRHGAGIGLLSRFMAETAPDIRPIAALIEPAKIVVTLTARHDALARRDVQVVREALHEEVRERRRELLFPASRIP